MPAFAGALDGRSGAVQLVAAAGLWTGWVIVLVATLVPSPPSLTVVRLLTPAARWPPASWPPSPAPARWPPWPPSPSAPVAAIVAGTAEVGWVFVQAAAYGDETRFLLRPPGPLVAGPIGAGVAGRWRPPRAPGRCCWRRRAWLAGLVVTAAAVALAIVLGPRFHRLALRWFVFVPAGVVVRDPLVLTDTAMFRRADVQALSLALAGTAATDLTARALGPAVEVDLAGAGHHRRRRPVRGRARRTQHRIDAFLISPSRPGRVLAEAERRAYPVTARTT